MGEDCRPGRSATGFDWNCLTSLQIEHVKELYGALYTFDKRCIDVQLEVAGFIDGQILWSEETVRSYDRATDE